MGLFGKIKNILFEDEDEVEEMPVYTKEEVKETAKKVEVEEPTPVVEEPIKTSDNSYFTNVKRDIDLSYDERDVLGDVTETKREVVEVRKEVKEEVVEPKPEEKKSVFLSFDEEEFERLNSRITKNENRVKRETQIANNVSYTDARRANNNFSATTTTRDSRVDNTDRYKIGNTPKKTFTPSPIISPVYGILDKNYTKDDIVDKKGGMKREKVVKPIVKKEEPVVTIEQAEEKMNNTVEIDIDSVRKKAYGELEDLEKTFTKIETPKLKEEPVKEEKVEVETEVSVMDIPDVKAVPEKVEPTIEDELETEFKVSDIKNEEPDLDDIVDVVIEPKLEEKKPALKEEAPTKSNPKILDDLEKTSTLQILDDIEKELNSIKPISKDIDVMDEEEDIPKNDTLEKDLFNLIDSMYVEGEEEEEDDYR